ncbi:MAG: peptidyl-prolyl cis-trans isomerase [Gammaproteobacteria bacterium]
MVDNKPSATQANTLLREPMLHFFLIALLIFGFYALANRSAEDTLEIDQREIDARIFMQEMATGEALTEEQRQFVTASFIEEQILVQEALALGLDNDARIHDMLAQKMRHVLSGNIIQPSNEELQNYYQANLERYRTLPSLDVMELVANSREELPVAAQQLLANGAPAEEVLSVIEGNSDPLPNVNHLDLANIFSPELADQAFAASPGDWVGPFVSNRGQHWLQILDSTPAQLPPLAEIRDRVRLEWINEKEEARLNEQIAQLWEKYTVIITEGANGQE